MVSFGNDKKKNSILSHTPELCYAVHSITIDFEYLEEEKKNTMNIKLDAHTPELCYAVHSIVPDSMLSIVVVQQLQSALRLQLGPLLQQFGHLGHLQKVYISFEGQTNS